MTSVQMRLPAGQIARLKADGEVVSMMYDGSYHRVTGAVGAPDWCVRLALEGVDKPVVVDRNVEVALVIW